MEEENPSSSRAKNNQVLPISSAEELDKESKDVMPPSDQKLLLLKTKNQLRSSEELKFTANSPARAKGKSQSSPKKKPGKGSKKKNQRVSFNEQVNQVHFVENWKSYNMENSVSKSGSHCCRVM